MSNLMLVISLLLHTTAALSNYSKEHLIQEEVSLWCTSHPYGHIYSDGTYYSCSHNTEDWEEIQVRTNRMKGIQLRVGIIPNKKGYDYDCGGYIDKNQFRSKETYGHYILNLLQEILGFEVQYVVTDTWGAYDEARNNWTGLVGLAKGNFIDLASCHTTITEDRENVVDFLLSTLSSTRSFVFDPSKLPLTRDVFVLTFSPMLWLCFFSSTVLLVICFRISTWAHSKLRPDHEPWSWIEVVMWANAAICQQSYSRHPKGSSCRTTFLIGYLITYLLYTGFAAGVTSHLAVKGHDIHLDFKDVVIMRLNLVIQSDGTQFDFLKSSPDPHARTLYSRLQRLLESGVDSLQELFAKIDQENFIGFGTTVTLHNYLWRNMPERENDFTISRIFNSYHQKAFLLPKRSPYKETFNYWILRLVESGLLNFGGNKHIRIGEANFCQHPGWSSAGLGNVFSAFVILVGGWFFSALILFVEMAWKRKTTSSEWEVASRRDVYEQLMRKKLGGLRKFNE